MNVCGCHWIDVQELKIHERTNRWWNGATHLIVGEVTVQCHHHHWIIISSARLWIECVICSLIGMHVQFRDSAVVQARHAKPLLVARITSEPIWIVLPLGTIGGGVKVHESLSCIDDWAISTAPRHESFGVYCWRLPNVRCADGTSARTASAKTQRTLKTATAAAW